MKVLVISPGVLPIPASKGGAVEKLIEAYIKYNEENHKVDFSLYTVKEEHDYNTKFKNTKYIYIDTQSFGYKVSQAVRYIINNKLPQIHIGNAFISRVKKKLKKDKINYDVIIVENTPFNVLELRKLYPKTKIIYHIHNDYLNCETKKAMKILDACDEIIAISDFIKKRIQTIKPTNKISVVYNGIDIEKFCQEIPKDEIKKNKEKYQLTNKDIVFLYTGRIVPEKGVKELILAFCKILKDTNNFNLKLLIVR